MDPTVEDIIYGNGDDSSGGVHAMDFRKELELCGVVLGNGAALLLAFPDGGLSGPEASQSRWLRSQDVVSIALENRFVDGFIWRGRMGFFHSFCSWTTL